MEFEIVPNVKKIFILRALVLGDLIFIIPALQALRNTYPQAEIVYASRPWAVDFVTGRLSSVDRVIGIRSAPHDYEDIGFLIHPEDAAWFFPQMQAEKFDLAFQMQGGGLNANPFIKRLNPRVSIGSREDRAIPLDRWIFHDYYQHDVIRNLELAGLAGAQSSSWTPCLPVLEADLLDAAPFLAEIGRSFVVIHAGARDIRRCWPPEKFAAVADYIIREQRLEVVLTGSSVDARVAFEVEQAMQETPVNLSHQLTLPALVGVLSKASLIVSNDTGVLHTGLAVGAKAVGLYWGEYVSKSLPLSRETFQPVIAWDWRCPECGVFLDKEEVVRADPRACMHFVSFIRSITVEQVLKAAEKMLSYDTSPRQAAKQF